MKQRVCLLLAALVLVLAVCTSCADENGPGSSLSQSPPKSQGTASSELSPSSAPVSETASQGEPELTEREKLWREDLEYFKETYTKKHEDPFYYVSEEELNWQLEQLAQRVPELSDTDMYFELAKIVAGFKDVHTSLGMTDDFDSRRFPFGVMYFGDKLYLYGYWEEFEELEPYLLHEIVSVDGIDIRYLQKKAESILCPTNEWYSKEFFTYNYFIPAFFDWAGCDPTDGYEFQFLDDEQKVVSVAVPTITPDEAVSGTPVAPEGLKKLSFLRGERGVELVEDGQGASCVVVNFGMVLEGDQAAYQELFRSAAELLTEHPEAKLLIDLRYNGGGWYSPVQYIRLNAELLTEFRRPETYVAANGFTMSAATDILVFFREELDAVQVGEPTGQFSSYFTAADGGRTLPNSGIRFRVSQGWQDGRTSEEPLRDENGKLYEWENTVLPDVYVSQKIEDVKEGKDSVIEWILEH